MLPDRRTGIELASASILALVFVLIARSRDGAEVVVCSDGPCAVGSAASWIWTGAGAVAPFVALAGFSWTRRLHGRDELGPFVHRRIPDIEEIAEVAAVLVSIACAYLVVRMGPKHPIIESTWPNSWLENRLGTDENGSPLVPTRGSWFVIGALVASPFAFGLGSAVGREWYGRQRKRSAELGED